MPLFEAVTIEVGAAIAKSILKLWLKDSSLGEDVSSSIVDVLKSRTSDRLAQRAGQRQFERIGEKVSESLLSLFEGEGARLDEGSRTSVAYEVAAAFNKSMLSAELLAKSNLEPTKLARQVLASHSIVAASFSDTERAFYQRIIEESCAYIVDIASQLPSFTEQTFAEVLKREDQIIIITDQILREVFRIRKQLDLMTEAGRFEEDYRKGVARNLDVLQLLGVDASSSNRRHHLSVAYITLSVEQKPQALAKDEHFAPAMAVDAFEDAGNVVETERVPVDEALETSRCLMVRGLAGSGKTTLLQWIAVNAATGSFGGRLADWNDTVPFFIRLRQCIQSGLPRPEGFPGLVVPAIADRMPRGWVHAQLEVGRATVLVDGLDEVSALQRENVRVWLWDLVEAYPRARYIVTSRPHAVEEGWMGYEGFSDAELQPMELVDIYSFIERWHDAMREALHEDEEKAELEPLAEHLKEEVKDNRPLRNLATNPLMCAMLCTLNRDRRRQLPADRIELYEACCNLLLERRDKARGVDLTDFPALNYRQKRLLLEDLAYWMIKNGWSEAALRRVDERFERKLKDMPGISPDTSGAGVRRLFVGRTGIIREPVAGQIDFTHRTFEEFLAAKAAVDEMDTGLLVENADDVQWREVIILASGLASRQMREELIKDLIARGDADKERQYQLHLLAVSCLETSVELGQDIQTEVERRLSGLVPPKNMTEARALAAAGELAVKYLAKKRKRSATTDAACVRALALIGGDSTLDVLVGYANDTRSGVRNELIKGWDSFDRKTYAELILSKTFRDESYLKMNRLSSLDGMQFFTNLTDLNLSGCRKISDLSPLGSLRSLTTLNLSRCEQINDLSPLGSLRSLTTLDLSGCEQVSDLSPLGSLRSLTTLDLSGCEQVSDLSPLASMTSLVTLSLWWCEQVSDLSPLASMTSLVTLSLRGCEQVRDLSPLGSLRSLTNLNLSGCGQVNDLSPLGSLRSLTTLDLSRCEQVRDLSPLANLTNMTNLTSLNLSRCEQVGDLSPLTGMTSLTDLDLSGCGQVSDLSPLTGMTNLTTLDLSGCGQVRDLSPLGSLRSLTNLSLSGCGQINDLSSLAGLKSLTNLNLSGCEQVSNVSPLGSLRSLTNLNLSGCEQVNDLSPLGSLRSLTNLDLSGCEQVSDLSPLGSLKRLTILNVSECEQVSDLSPLTGLNNLKYLILRGIINKVTIPQNVKERVRIL